MRHPFRAALLGHAKLSRVELADRGVDGLTNRFRRVGRVELGAPLPGGVDRLLQRIHGKARALRTRPLFYLCVAAFAEPALRIAYMRSIPLRRYMVLNRCAKVRLTVSCSGRSLRNTSG